MIGSQTGHCTFGGVVVENLRIKTSSDSKNMLEIAELAHQDIIRQLKLEHAKEITKSRQEFELQARELQQMYEKKMKMLRDDLELRRMLILQQR
eukprot:gene22027-29087_t